MAGIMLEASIMSEFGVKDITENGEKVARYVLRTLSITVCISIQYTWYKTDEDMSVKSLINYVLVRRNRIRWVNGKKLVGEMSD